jgi:hypothetical protein
MLNRRGGHFGGFRPRPLLVLLAVAVLSSDLPAQDLQHEVSVINIEVPVRVYKGSRFVNSLSLDDFEIYEDGKLQRIEAAYLIGKTEVKKSEGRSAPALKPKVESRHFVLFFEMDEYLYEVNKVLEEFIGSVIQPSDTAWIVTPKSGIQLKQDALAKVPRPTIVEQLKSRLKRDIGVTSMALRGLLGDLEYLATVGTDEARFAARTIFERLRDMKVLDETKFVEFADLLKNLEGPKHVFIIYQKEVIAVPGAFAGFAADLDYVRKDFANQERIRKVYADVSATIHFLYVTKTRTNLKDIDVGSSDGKAAYLPDGGSGDFFQAFRQLANVTGGRAESSANTAWLFDKAVEATENYYLLYYRPAEYRADGSYKEITVKVKGSGYTVSHRAGYIAK